MINQTELVRLYRKRTAQTSGRRFLGLDYYDHHFHLDSVPFDKLSETQKQGLLAELLDAWALYYDQFILDHMEGRQYAVAHDIEKLNHYQALIATLSTWPLPQIHTADRDYSYIQAINQPISTANQVRFTYLWEGGLLQSGSLSPEWRNAFNEVSLYSGSASFLFYFLRGGTRLINRLKHVTGSWGMTNEEKALFETVGFYERLKSQLNMDKYDLLNDLVWAPANLACFVWYNTYNVYHFLGLTLRVGSKGSHAAEVGNVLTVLLFGMDFLSSLCQWMEAEREYQQHLAVLRHELTRLDSRKKRKEIASFMFEYKYKQVTLYVDLAYSLSLVIGFAVMVGVLGNPFTLSAGIVGSLMCSGASIIKDLIQNNIALEKAREEQWLIKKEHDTLLSQWNPAQLNSNGNDIIRHEHLFLESAFFRKQAEMDLAFDKCSFSLILGITRPAVLWSAMIFCPWNHSVMIVAAALLVAYVAYQYLIQYQERCLDDCELVTDERYITKNIAYVRTEHSLTYIDKRQGIHQDISEHLNAFKTCTQASPLNTAYQFLYALVTLAPIFSNMDALMDELCKFSSSRRLTDGQLKDIKKQVTFVPQAPALPLNKPASLVIHQSENRGFFWNPWNANIQESDNFVYCQMPV